MASPSTPPVGRYRRRSFAGPVVLIMIGIIFLLGNMGFLAWHTLATGFAHYWPFLLIVWGVIKLVEYYAARNSGYAASGIGAGGIVLIVFLVLIGMGASVGERFGHNINWDNNDWGSWGNRFEFTETLEQPFTPGNILRVNSTHGDITITPWDEDKIKVVATKHVPGESEDQAKKLGDSLHPSITSSGNVTTLNSGNGNVRVNGPWFASSSVGVDLEVYVPKKAGIDLNSSHGDVKISGTEGDLRINSEHGDLNVENITGNARITEQHGDLTVSHLTGDITADGHLGTVDISSIGGNVTLNGEYFEADVTLAQIGKYVRFNTSRTNIEMGALPGDLKMDSGDLRVESASGGFSIRTRSKDLHLENIGGNVEIENSNADVELHAGSLPLGDVSVHSHRGPIQIYLPPQFPFQLQAESHGGEIQSDFDVVKIDSHGNEARAAGATAPNGRHVQLDADGGDIEIRKGLSSASVPAMPAVPPIPVPPGAHSPHAPKAPHAPQSKEPPQPPGGSESPSQVI